MQSEFIKFIPKRHWTPRYVVNVCRMLWYQKRNPDTPWLTPAANRILATALLPTDIGLEFGSGRSTLWFAQRMKHLTSVEHDPAWHNTILKKIRARNLPVDYLLHSQMNDQDPAQTGYVRVAEQFENESLDFALVDGIYRDHCAWAVLNKIKPGGLLVIDNASSYFDHPTYAPRSQFGKGPLNQVWGGVWDHLRNWRMVWTTQGVTDTAIWFRPNPRI